MEGLGTGLHCVHFSFSELESHLRPYSSFSVYGFRVEALGLRVWSVGFGKYGAPKPFIGFRD